MECRKLILESKKSRGETTNSWVSMDHEGFFCLVIYVLSILGVKENPEMVHYQLKKVKCLFSLLLTEALKYFTFFWERSRMI